MKKIRIFVDAHAFDRGIDGVASYILGLYTHLIKLYPGQYHLYFGCADENNFPESLARNTNVEIVKYNTSNKYSRLLVDMPLIINRIGPEFSHFQYFTPIIKTCPWIVTIHDVLFNDFSAHFPLYYRYTRNLLFPISAARADILTTDSKYSKDRINYWYKINRDKINVIPAGISLKSKEQSPDSREIHSIIYNTNGYILCVSRFEPRKNQITLLDAYITGKLWMKGILLIFVGSRSLPIEEFDNRIKSLPAYISKKIVFLSNLNQKDIDCLYAHALAAVYPSIAEGFGMPPLEAASFGIPSLCAPVTAMKDYDFLSPFFIEPNDSDKLMEILNNVIENKLYYKSIAECTATEVINRYSWSVASNSFHQMISKFLTT